MAVFKPAAVAAARAADEKKGDEIVLLHTGPAHPLADYLLIITALSKPHLESVEVGVDQALKSFGLRCLRQAHPRSDRWRVLDYGGLMIHILTAETRAFYALDKLYHGATRVKWQPRASATERETAPGRSR